MNGGTTTSSQSRPSGRVASMAPLTMVTSNAVTGRGQQSVPPPSHPAKPTSQTHVASPSSTAFAPQGTAAMVTLAAGPTVERSPSDATAAQAQTSSGKVASYDTVLV